MLRNVRSLSQDSARFYTGLSATRSEAPLSHLPVRARAFTLGTENTVLNVAHGSGCARVIDRASDLPDCGRATCCSDPGPLSRFLKDTVNQGWHIRLHSVRSYRLRSHALPPVISISPTSRPGPEPHNACMDRPDLVCSRVPWSFAPWSSVCYDTSEPPRESPSEWTLATGR